MVLLAIILPISDIYWDWIVLVCKTLNDSVAVFFASIPNFAGYVQSSGIAFLTILIPLAIAVLGDAYKRRQDRQHELVWLENAERRQQYQENKKHELAWLDLLVIVDSIFEFKGLPLYAAAIFLPMIFFGLIPGVFSILLVMISAYGFWKIGKIYYSFYFWIKGDFDARRLYYLSSLTVQNDIIYAWKSVWESKKMDIDRLYYEMFATVLNDLLKKMHVRSSLIAAANILDSFNRNFNNRPLLNVFIFGDLFKNVLSWHWRSYEYLSELRENNRDIKHEGLVIHFLNVLEEFLREVMKKSFEGEDYHSFFDIFPGEIDRHSGNTRYLKRLMSVFYKIFFESASEDAFSMWDLAFPSHWKVTKANLESEKGQYAIISINEFTNWMRARISVNRDGDYDYRVDYINQNLFPEVDPTIWSVALIFASTAYDPNNRCKSVIGRAWIFGGVPRMNTYDALSGAASIEERIERDQESQRIATFDLIYALTPLRNHFSREQLLTYVEELNSLEYEDDPEKEDKRERMLDVFEKMLEYLDSMDTDDD